MRSLALILVIVVLAALGLWVWLGDEDANAVVAPPSVLPTASEAEVAALVDATNGPAPVVDGPRAAAEGSARVEHQPTAEAGFAEPPVDGIEVVVVRGPLPEASEGDAEFDPRTLEPVPLAEVLVLDTSVFSDADTMQLVGGGLDFDRIFEEHGQRFRADGRGRVRVPAKAEGIQLLGRARDLWGVQEFDAEAAEPVPLVVLPDPAIEVRVVDETDAPVVGVPVAIGFAAGGNRINLFTMRTAAPHGQAVLRHAEQLLEIVGGDGVVTAAIPLATPVTVPIDPENFPTAPIVLRIPRTGRLEVRVHDREGKPIHAGVLVQAGILGPDDELPEDPGHSRYLPNAVTAIPDEEGRADFPFLEVAERVAVLVTSATGYEPWREIHPGPQQPGETVRVEVLLEELQPVLVGRLVDEEENPLADVVVEAHILACTENGRRRQRERARLRTDAAGTFRFPLQREQAAEETRSLVLELQGTTEDAPRGAEVRLPRKVPPGAYDLGDVTIGPLPLLAAGRVVDTQGDGIPEAMVALRMLSVGGPEGEAEWIEADDLTGRTDRDGEFAIHGWLDAVALRVRANHGSYLPSEEVDIARGAGDLLLVLHGAGTIAGSVLLDEGVPASRLTVRAWPSEMEPSERRGQTGRPGDDGSFELRKLSPGLWNVRLETPEEVAYVPNVEVVAGEAARDPRLQKIDLRGALLFVELHVVDAEGTALRRARAAVVGDAEDGTSPTISARNGTIQILTTRKALDLDVMCDGFRTQRLVDARGKMQVVLDRGIPVRFVLSDPDAAREEGCVVMASAFPRESSFTRTASRATFHRDGSATLLLREPGPHRVVLVVRADLGNGITRAVPILEAQLDFEVQDAWKEPTFTIRVTLDQLRAAIGR